MLSTRLPLTLLALSSFVVFAGCGSTPQPTASSDAESSAQTAADNATLQNIQLQKDALIRGDKVVLAKGHWDVGPLTILSLDPTTGAATGEGGDTFTGTFTGSSKYFISGNFLPDGSFVGYSDETITATAPDGSQGTITEAHQPLYISPTGKFYELSPITSGTGAWAGSTGQLIYTGVVDIQDPTDDSPGQGGTYEGVWIRPAK